MNYKELDLKIGLEIHKQLETHKLFCNCPSKLRDDKPDIKVKRYLRAVQSEIGETDQVALHEIQKGKYCVYEFYKDSNCLVELDEEPPYPINQDAVKIASEITLLLNAQFIDEIQVMRKQVIDFSNTSGFQRTAFFARNGFIKTNSGKVSINLIALEEDAARKVENGEDYVIYRLDRLGIPLVEIATDPDIKTPEQAKEVAAYLGMILKSTGKVKNGLGTLRQDINVSIKNGNRVEIKGAQDLNLIPKTIELEVMRQVKLLEIKKEIKKVKLDSKIYDLTSLFEKTESSVIKNSLDKDGAVYGIKLNNFNGFIGRELQPGRRLGTEFSERAKIKSGVKGIFHSDELPKYGITEEEVTKIKGELKCASKDGFVIVAEVKDKAKQALEAVLERAREVFEGVPKEVRNANPDGTTSYLRPMPGAARMYIETDVPTFSVTKKILKDIELPELIDEKALRYEKDYKLNSDLSRELAKKNAGYLEELIKKFSNIKPMFIAQVLTEMPKEIKTRLKSDTSKLTPTIFEEVLSYLSKNEIKQSAVFEILTDVCRGKKINLNNYKTMSDNELKREIKKIVSENKNAPFNALMGMVMDKFRGKVEGKKVVEILKELT